MIKRTHGEPDCGPTGSRRHIRYDRCEGEPASVAVVSALAAFTDDDALETNLRLYEFIDPEALDALFADHYGGSSRPGGQVTFAVNDLTVIVRADSVDVCR